ncbi:hypothetical protein BH09BAC2_BH09BAC2_11880 [soil metagenome]
MKWLIISLVGLFTYTEINRQTDPDVAQQKQYIRSRPSFQLHRSTVFINKRQPIIFSLFKYIKQQMNSLNEFRYYFFKPESEIVTTIYDVGCKMYNDLIWDV